MKENNVASKSDNDNLFKNTVIFTISNIATKLISFVLIPIYTRAMSTEDYGISDLLYTIGTVVIPLFTLNISEAVYRFLLDKDAKEKEITNVSLKVLLFGSIISVPVVALVMLLTPFRQYAAIYILYLISTMLFQVLSMNLRGKRRLKNFAFANILNMSLVAILSFLLVFVLKLSIFGFFLSYFIANIVSSIYVCKVGNIIGHFSVKGFDRRIFYDMAKYSVVLVPTTFMWWIINSSDKVMVTWLIDGSANGIYSVASRLPMILTTLAGIFNQAWVFTAVDKEGAKDEKKYTNKVFYMMFVVVFFMAMIFAIILKPFLYIYVDQNFFVAWKYVPLLLIGSSFVAMGTFLSVSYNVHKDSKGFLFSGLSGAVVNIILNFLLIPIMGITGAALATLISYVTVFAYRIFDTRKYIKIHFKPIYIVPVLLLGLVCAALFLDGIASIAIQLLVALIYVLIFRRELYKFTTGVLKKTMTLLSQKLKKV